MSQDTFMCTVVLSGEFIHQFTFCAIIPSHQIVGTYQYKRITCMSTCISGESLQPEILRIDCNHPSRWSVGGLHIFNERHPLVINLKWKNPFRLEQIG